MYGTGMGSHAASHKAKAKHAAKRAKKATKSAEESRETVAEERLENLVLARRAKRAKKPKAHKKAHKAKAAKAIKKVTGIIHAATGGPKLATMEFYQQTGLSTAVGGTWRWRLVARNGRILADSGEAYVKRSDAVKYGSMTLDLALARVEQREVATPSVPDGSQPPAPIPVIQTPGAPQNLTATANAAAPAGPVINLSWSAPVTGGPVLMYHVERKVGQGHFVLIVKHEDRLTVTHYIDEKVAPDKRYTYRVLAHGVNMEHGPWSNEASAKFVSTAGQAAPAQPPQLPATSMSVKITAPEDQTSVSGMFEINAKASANSGIQRLEVFVDDQSKGVQVSPLNGTYLFLVDSRPFPNGAHTLKVTATATSGQQATSNSLTIFVRN